MWSSRRSWRRRGRFCGRARRPPFDIGVIKRDWSRSARAASRDRSQTIPGRRISSGSVGPTLTGTLLIGYRGTVTLPGRSRSGSAAEDQGLSGRGRRVALAAARRVRGVDSFPLIVNPLDVGRRGQPQCEKPAGDGNVDIRILTSYFRLSILLPGKRTLAILLTGSNIPEGEASAV